MNEKVVMETIQRMSSSGLDDEIILGTLKDIGLPEEQALDMISRAKGPEKMEITEKPAQKIPYLQQKPVEMGDDESVADRVKQHLDEHALYTQMATGQLHEKIDGHSEAVSRHIDAMEEHRESLDNATEKIGSLHERMDDFSRKLETMPRQQVSAGSDIFSLKHEVEETKAIALVTKQLMEKILEVNRKILNRLEQRP